MEVWKLGCIATPSLICLDLCNLELQVRLLEDAGMELLHVDILDGHFSPSMPIGLDTVRQLRKKTQIPFDVHLMVTKQEFFIRELIDIGVQQILFHPETADHSDHLLNMIKSAGIRAGLALKPETPVGNLQYLIEKCDAVLLMQINPGFAGYKHEEKVPYADRKIKDIAELVSFRNPQTIVEIDGRVSVQDIKMYGGKEVNVFVCGTSSLDLSDLPGSMKKLNQLTARQRQIEKG